MLFDQNEDLIDIIQQTFDDENISSYKFLQEKLKYTFDSFNSYMNEFINKNKKTFIIYSNFDFDKNSRLLHTQADFFFNGN